MRRLAVLLVSVFFLHSAHSRDSGYALECAALETGEKLIVGFLEAEVDKKVRLITTNSQTMWDSHEWLADTIMVRSFIQLKGSDGAQITSSIEIERETLTAVLMRMDESKSRVKMQCKRWSPQSRNK